MPWLFRPLTTLLLGPIVYLAVTLYLRSTTSGGDVAWAAAGQLLWRTYLTFTLPALALMLVLLLPVDLILRRTGFGLATILISPVLAVAAVSLLRDVVSHPQIQAWSSLWLAAAYGLVWGLTIRDPRTVMAA